MEEYLETDVSSVGSLTLESEIKQEMYRTVAWNLFPVTYRRCASPRFCILVVEVVSCSLAAYHVVTT